MSCFSCSKLLASLVSAANAACAGASDTAAMISRVAAPHIRVNIYRFLSRRSQADRHNALNKDSVDLVPAREGRRRASTRLQPVTMFREPTSNEKGLSVGNPEPKNAT